MRQFYRALAGVELPASPGFDLDNRGKRSVALDLVDPAARDSARALILGADVFITNYRKDALARLGLDYESLAAASPRLVYGYVTGYGQDGPDAERAGYDIGAFWARAGIASILAQAGAAPAGSRAGFGDHTTASHLLAGVLAALLARERTGRGQLVDACLLRSGIYTIGFDVTQQLAFGGVTSAGKREESPSPTITCYRAGDGRWVWMLGVEADRHWPRLAQAFDLESLVSDPRFASAPLRAANCRDLIKILDEQFAKRPLADWIPRLDAADVWWAPVNTPEEVTRDGQAIAAGAFVDVPDGKGGTAKSVSSPVLFSGADVTPRRKVPEIGEHTSEVLAELRDSENARTHFVPSSRRPHISPNHRYAPSVGAKRPRGDEADGIACLEERASSSDRTARSERPRGREPRRREARRRRDCEECPASSRTHPRRARSVHDRKLSGSRHEDRGD